ncbi:hypothetical protein PCE1_003701 [Barthelona sp. PCE]
MFPSPDPFLSAGLSADPFLSSGGLDSVSESSFSGGLIRSVDAPTEVENHIDRLDISPFSLSSPKDERRVFAIKLPKEERTSSITYEETLEQVKCPICHSRFVDPIFFECGHSFCRRCIRSCVEAGSKLCPICRTGLSALKCYHFIPHNRVTTDIIDDMPSNLALSCAVDALHNTKHISNFNRQKIVRYSNAFEFIHKITGKRYFSFDVLNHEATKEDYKSLKREINIQFSMRHRYILRAKFILLDDREGVSHKVGLLTNYITKDIGEFFSTKTSLIERIEICAQLAMGLSSIHSHGYAHCNFFTSFIRYDSNRKEIKIGDFRCATRELMVHKEHFRWLPFNIPELMPTNEELEVDPFAIDVYCLGLLMAAIIAGEHPGKNAQDKVHTQLSIATVPPMPQCANEWHNVCTSIAKYGNADPLLRPPAFCIVNPIRRLLAKLKVPIPESPHPVPSTLELDLDIAVTSKDEAGSPTQIQRPQYTKRALFNQLKKGKLDMLEMAIEKRDIDFILDARTDDNSTILHKLAMVTNPNVVKVANTLTQIGLRPSDVNAIGLNALHRAIYHGNVALCRFWLDRFPELRNIPSKSGMSPKDMMRSSLNQDVRALID